MARRPAFRRPLVMAGWPPGSGWGYDDVLESYWAELVPTAGDRVRVGPEHLLVTLPALAAAVAAATGCLREDAYLALVA